MAGSGAAQCDIGYPVVYNQAIFLVIHRAVDDVVEVSESRSRVGYDSVIPLSEIVMTIVENAELREGRRDPSRDDIRALDMAGDTLPVVEAKVAGRVPNDFRLCPVGRCSR